MGTDSRLGFQSAGCPTSSGESSGHLDDSPSSRRELEFYDLVSADSFLQGKIDLTLPDGAGIAALDVKTGGGAAKALRGAADGYSLQRSGYVGALGAIGGLPVTKFLFHSASDGVKIGGPVGDELRAAAVQDVQRALDAMGGEAAALTQHAAECRFCGYRNVRWCEGVPA
jgi:hypothetical protein